jgi:hypothetical protein
MGGFPVSKGHPMNIASILALLEALAKQSGLQTVEQSLLPIIIVYIATHPGVTDAEIVSSEDGTLKHYYRGKIGFGVDIIWPYVEPALEQAITAEIPAARAALEPPPAPPVVTPEVSPTDPLMP